MLKLAAILLLALVLCRLLLGRWPYLDRIIPEPAEVRRARALLGLDRSASPEEIRAAHKRLLASTHPDKGGTAAQVHEADTARDLLLATAGRRQKHSP